MNVRQSAESLNEFYASKCGRAAQRMVLRRLHTLWPHLEGADVLGYGFTHPFLNGYEARAQRVIYAMPENQGGLNRINARGNASVQVHDHKLPFPPGIFDHVLVAHGLEEVRRLPALLSELWRVMKPEGRIVIMTANRSGLWALSDKTPFGAGRPFSRRQLSAALQGARFQTLARSGALYGPPVDFLSGPRTSGALEKFGETVWPPLSGVVLVEATKRMYAGVDSKVQKRVLRPNFGSAAPIGAQGKTASRAIGDAMEMNKRKIG